MMRRLGMIAAATALLALAGATALRTGTVAYPPHGYPLFLVDVPPDWSPTVLDDGHLAARSPDGAAYLNAWLLQEPEDFDALEFNIGMLTASWITNPALAQNPEKIKSAHLEFLVHKGLGQAKDDGSPVHFEVFIFPVAPEGQFGVLYIDYELNAPPETLSALKKIALSIRQPEQRD